MKIIGFTEQETNNIWRVVSGVLYFGNLAFTQSKRDESAQITDISGAFRTRSSHLTVLT